MTPGSEEKGRAGAASTPTPSVSVTPGSEVKGRAGAGFDSNSFGFRDSRQ